jgi:hypothetical protein
MSFAKSFLSAVLLVALVGCAAVDVTKTSKGFYNPTNPNDVDILKTRPARAYEELGTITAVKFAVSDTAVMHNEIRGKSAALGANAAILTEEGISEGSKKWATGVAIRYKD